ncbi:MAG: S8 family peptidase [Planctomycetota bacterium]
MRFNQDVPPAVAEAILAETGAGVILDRDWSRMEGAYRCRSDFRNGFEVLAVANALARRPEVRWAEPDRIATSRSADVIPNDPAFSVLWGLHNTGQSNGTPDMDMDAPEAWDLEIGEPIIVVILDDGVQLDHPDLGGIISFDFTSDDGNGGPVNECDNHGTTVAGTVAAIMNNNLGVVGIAPGCSIASARYKISNVPCDGAGIHQISWYVDALQWAVDINARVTNASQSFSPNSAITDKYAQTRAAGLVHFASTGNDSQASINYPSSLPTVNAVGAIDRDGNRAAFSNYGAGIGFVAPGKDIWTTDRTGTDGDSGSDYDMVSGTSFSSPYAAGVAALVISQDQSLTPYDVEYILQITSMNLGAAGYDTTFGWGLVNAHQAILNVVTSSCGSGAGSCYEPSPSDPGCNDVECCLAVCDADPFCCVTRWDEQCVTEALELCAGCGTPDAGDCYAANGSHGCADSDCCAIVCAVNPYCCDVDWDAQCASYAVQNCPPPNDDCQDATPISGAGPFSFNNILAVQDGLNHLACYYSAQAAIRRDVWFCWTASCSGLATVSTCQGTSVDTKIAVYDDCFLCPPTDDELLGCIDDTCGLQTEVVFNAIAGHRYLVRIGVYPGADGGVGTFTIDCQPVGPPNDDCANAEFVWDGVVPFDSIGATTDGPPLPPSCDEGYGLSFVNDVWFLWPASCAGVATVSLCEADYDTRLAVYDYAGETCPGALVACNDDACGDEATRSAVTFFTSPGAQYLIRVGGYGGSGTGLMTVTCEPGTPCPWDCQTTPDGLVNVPDFLQMLAQWGQAGTSCDYDGGGVSVTDFLELLANWGACP